MVNSGGVNVALMLLFLLMTFVLFADNSIPEHQLVNHSVKKNTFSAAQPGFSRVTNPFLSNEIKALKNVARCYIPPTTRPFRHEPPRTTRLAAAPRRVLAAFARHPSSITAIPHCNKALRDYILIFAKEKIRK
ncbi:hypothetical protein KIF53_00070 [Chromobacterium subtsugae]|uniref:Uncharacterized protein n=1 Tax=Chromobacterium subtsugae TaxID=251747 RepID=A0ABS7F7V5_9NEIS|nr:MULTISPECIES: hypothetical protein [Chromobacterium]MBW7568826.1 hypothetical protein [Chromobacterium subtsugae]MBW8286027.1 hypothetical protein [Chromobacterium subtsugae]WSE91916.1 hypothetical protein U6115_01360 [Chromobacterium subtsugae]WVH60290.1 hypothetical protein U6151_01360 [Chromobacterium subtsugae]